MVTRYSLSSISICVCLPRFLWGILRYNLLDVQCSSIEIYPPFFYVCMYGFGWFIFFGVVEVRRVGCRRVGDTYSQLVRRQESRSNPCKITPTDKARSISETEIKVAMTDKLWDTTLIHSLTKLIGQWHGGSTSVQAALGPPRDNTGQLGS
jgi:hypothetical protein